MATEFTLTNADVNSGASVLLKGAKLTWNFKQLTRTTPLTNQFTLVETQVAGFENPKIVINGIIDANDTTANVVSQKLLRDFMIEPYSGTTPPTPTYLKVSVGSQPLYIVGTKSTTAPTTEQTIKVVVESISIAADASDSYEGHYIPYVLTLVETA